MKTFEPFFYGGVASCLSEAVTFPIDLVKTRLQIQGQKMTLADSQSAVRVRYSGMLNCFTLIVKEEGIKALYAG